MGQSGWVQTLRISPLSMPSETMASVMYLQVLNSGHFAFSGVSGLSSMISTYLLGGMALLLSDYALYAVLIWCRAALKSRNLFCRAIWRHLNPGIRRAVCTQIPDRN